jgi:hypothetical protein
MLPDVAPVMTLALWAYEFRVMLTSRQLHRRQKFKVTVLTMVHVNNRISSPLHA